MKPIQSEDPLAKSDELISSNIERLKQLFPEAWKEGKLDFEVLRQLLGGSIDESDEKYGLNWHGKRRARQIALTPSAGTLRPCPEDSVDWDNTKNLMIEGDNLEVLKLLQKSYAGKVKLIYIDPPYNTGKDFVYPDNFQDNIKNYLELTGQTGEGGVKLTTNVEASGRFHTDWLNMMYPRLKLAWPLLSPDGFIAISISDSEVGNLRGIMDELFGPGSLIEMFVWESIFRPSNMSRRTRRNAEYVLLYAKDPTRDFELIERLEDPQGDASLTQNNNSVRTLRFPAGSLLIGLSDGLYPKGSRGEVEAIDDLVVRDGRNASEFKIAGKFKWSQEYLNEEILKGVTLRIKSEGLIPYYRKTYQQTALRPTKLIPRDIVGDVLSANAEIRTVMGADVFSYPKPSSLICYLQNCVGLTEGEMLLDFFAGSGTSGHAVYKRNLEKGAGCRYMLVQLPEPLVDCSEEQGVAVKFCDSIGRSRTIAELTKERLRRVGKMTKSESPITDADLGFRVFKLDSTNIREWDPDKTKIAESLEAHVEHIKADRSEQDILFELLLKLGLDLCVNIETMKIQGKEVHSIGAGALIACLVAEIKSDQVEQLAQGIVAWHKAQNTAGDSLIIFRDSAFADDVAKTNLTSILNQNGLHNVRSL